MKSYPELIKNKKAQRVRKKYNEVIIEINKAMGMKDYYELQPDYTKKLKNIPTT